MPTISHINFTGNPCKSFDVFSQQIIKASQKGQKTDLKKFTKNLTSYTDSFEVNKDILNKKSRKLAETLVSLNKNDMASIVYSFLIKLNKGNLNIIEELATNALKIAKRLNDPIHIMARANDLREIYKITPPKGNKFINVLYDEKRALKDIINNYDNIYTKNKQVKPKENYKTLLAEIKFDIGNNLHEDKNLAKKELSEAKEMFLELGLTEKAKLINI